ncbi:protein of unknown function [Porphyromonadaceae bacterium NLAE-zl-C104]|nr:protein of unknown function [Porphyromonadaceae bacterium NLAE-zl-C104]
MKKKISPLLILTVITFLLGCVACSEPDTPSVIDDWESIIKDKDPIPGPDPDPDDPNPPGGDTQSFFKMRGIVAGWSDVSNPSKIDYIQIAKDNGINTFSIFNADRNSLAWKDFAAKCAEANINLEYEEHMLAFLIPRELFDEHPEYFRMNKQGVRVNDANGCPSSEGALAEVFKNAKKIGRDYEPTNNRYYFWLDDGGDICHCDQCKGYNAADQALIFENEIIKALKEINPDAMLAHLCYHNTVDPPSKIKPHEDIFLEFAPFTRSWSAPLSHTWVRSPRSTLTHADYLKALRDNLKIFPVETAQVLEYWMDASLFSEWNPNNLVKIPWNDDIFMDDLDTYASLGIRNITCYTAFVGPDYVTKFGDISFLSKYGQGLLKYKPK